MMKKIKAQPGQAMVEFAFILPLLVIMILGIIEFSILLYDQAIVTNASREGARAGIVYRADANTAAYSPVTDAEIAAVVRTYLQSRLVAFGAPVNETTTVLERGTSPGGNLRLRVRIPSIDNVLPNFSSKDVSG